MTDRVEGVLLSSQVVLQLIRAATNRVSDSGTHTGQVSTIAGGGAGSRGFQDGPAAKAKFAWPYGVATSPDGHTVYVGDSGNNRVRSIDVLSGTVSTLAGTGIAGYQDGAASAARFYGPRGVVASPDGSLVFVADYSNFRVRTLELAGGEHGEATVSTLFGGKGEIYRPAGVAVTSNGEWVLAADSANAKIRGVQVSSLNLEAPSSFSGSLASAVADSGVSVAPAAAAVASTQNSSPPVQFPSGRENNRVIHGET